MLDEELREAIHALGVDEGSRDVLALLPLVWVAWADGKVHPAEHAVITEVARDRLSLSPDGSRVLDNWLAHAPTPSYLDRGCGLLLELGRRIGAPPDLPLVELCREVARAEGGFFVRITPPEREALSKVAEALALDPTLAWERVRAHLLERPDAAAWAEEEITRPGTTPAAPAREGPPGLAAIDGETERTVPLGDRVRIGRGSGNELQLRYDGLASRQHCEILRREGRVFVRDLGSTNGTFVMGERVIERELFGGELLRVGESMLRWRAPVG